MASNYTAKYRLSQWAAADKVLRTEFNTDNARIESALAGLEAGKASVSALNALSAVVDGKADQAGLDQVVQSAANQDKNLALRNCAAHLESYMGDGASSRTFSFPGRPWLIIIFTPSRYVALAVRGRAESFMIGSDAELRTTFSWSGNSATFTENASRDINLLGRQYTLFALLEP